MLSTKNVVMLSGGLTRDAEYRESPGIVEMSLAVDGSGTQKDVQNASGYFDVKVWMNTSKYSPAATAENVKKLLDEGVLTKGTRVSIVGRLVHERWTNKDTGKIDSRVSIVAETVDAYRAGAGASNSNRETTSSAQTTPVSSASALDDF
jgi:single-stranded DNA-binding protein